MEIEEELTYGITLEDGTKTSLSEEELFTVMMSSIKLKDMTVSLNVTRQIRQYEPVKLGFSETLDMTPLQKLVVQSTPETQEVFKSLAGRVVCEKLSRAFSFMNQRLDEELVARGVTPNIYAPSSKE